jgi:hypothetical protein
MRSALLRRAGMSFGVLVLFTVCCAFGRCQRSEPLIETQDYSVSLQKGDVPSLLIYVEHQQIFRLPVVSGISSSGKLEVLTQIELRQEPASSDRPLTLMAVAHSSLWQQRRFVWKFYPDHIEFQHFASGSATVERCYFFSNGVSGKYFNGDTAGVQSNSTIYADKYFTPRVAHSDQHYYTIAMPDRIGVAAADTDSEYERLNASTLFAPAPLARAFRRGGRWVSVGIGTTPGAYNFNGFDYSGSRYAGASFFVDEQNREPGKDFASPVAALHFGYSEFEVLKDYVRWIDASGFGTEHRYPDVPWHHLPIFCGWAEQTLIAPGYIVGAHDHATQENYENWIRILEERGLPVGTIVIDDKWQKHYGTFDVDVSKWPDLPGFIARQHAKGRHVLLWVPAHQSEGLPRELTVQRKGLAIAGDVSNPAYEAFLRTQIKHLVKDVGVDGFKEDWLDGIWDYSDVAQHAPLFGIEFLRKFQFILYDETHKWKPDAMVETQTPNPLFRESSDVLRLNDIYYASRDVTEMMRLRARIAWIAGWPLVDCDNASETDLEEWWQYMEAQPTIGIPALYFVSRMESTGEVVPPEMWKRLASIWRDYVRGVVH